MKRERSPGEDDLAQLMKLNLAQKTQMLACLLPCQCGHCSYFCCSTGTPEGACLQCHHAAKDHGQLVGEQAINEKMTALVMVAKKLSEETGMNPSKALKSLLEPVAAAEPMRDTPPFETPVMAQFLVSFARYLQFLAADNATAKASSRQAVSLLSKLVDSAIFYQAYHAQRKNAGDVDTDLVMQLWRNKGHKCPEEKKCELCLEDAANGVDRGEMRKPTELFGEQFLKQTWDAFRRCVRGVSDLNPGVQVEQVSMELERQLRLGRASIIFSPDAKVRLTLMGPLKMALVELPKKALQQSGGGSLLRSLGSQEHLSSLSPSTKKLRGNEAKEAMDKGDALVVKVVMNSADPEGWELLIGLKEVISKQLPEMPKYYIMRALFDGNHQSLCVSKNGKVVGGCTFRPFVKQGFVEVVFLVVNPNTTNKGLGSLIMSEVKTYVFGQLEVQYLLTYADNTAIEFFKKQGFQRDVTLSRSRWAGYIKDYTKATLMEYHIAPQRDAAIAQQAQWIKSCVTAVLDRSEVKEGLNKRTVFPIKPKAIGVEAEEHLAQRMKRVILVLKRFRYIGPFLKPVDPNEAPRYYDIIKKPMSLQDVERKLEGGEYPEWSIFERDLKQIALNCQIYNDSSSWYYKHAEKLLETLTKIL